MDLGVVASVFNEALFDVDTEWVDYYFIGSCQGEDGFGNGTIDLSFFDFV